MNIYKIHNYVIIINNHHIVKCRNRTKKPVFEPCLELKWKINLY